MLRVTKPAFWYSLVALLLLAAAAGFHLLATDRDEVAGGQAEGSTYDASKFPMHHAASEGDAGEVSRLLASGMEADHADEMGMTPLFVASFHGRLDVARVLVGAGADAGTADNQNLSPLHLASVRGHLEVARLLLDSGAKVDGLANTYGTPLHFAAHGGEIDIARMLVERGADIDSLGDNNTPLSRAAGKGHLDIVGFLLSAGADPDGRADGDEIAAPLYFASFAGHKEVALSLLEAGAGVDVRSVTGFTPLFIATIAGRNEILPILIGAGADVNKDDNVTGLAPLQALVKYRLMDEEKYLIDYDDGIMHETVSILLAAGADPDRKVILPNYDEDVLVLKGRLMASAGDVTSLASGPWGAGRHDESGEAWTTSLFLSAYQGTDMVMRALLEGGADPDARYAEGAGMLHFAVEIANSVGLASLLLGHGADVNIGDASGSTPLHYAAYHGYDGMAGFLLESGADPNARNVVGMTPLDYASCLGNGSMRGLLIGQGADPAPRDAGVVPIGRVCEELLGGSPRLLAWLESRLELMPRLVGHKLWKEACSWSSSWQKGTNREHCDSFFA